jgi:hypothetical protein
MGSLFDLDLSSMAEKVGGLTKESVEELNATLRTAVRIKAASAILDNLEDSNRIARKEAMNLLIETMKGNF